MNKKATTSDAKFQSGREVFRKYVPNYRERRISDSKDAEPPISAKHEQDFIASLLLNFQKELEK